MRSRQRGSSCGSSRGRRRGRSSCRSSAPSLLPSRPSSRSCLSATSSHDCSAPMQAGWDHAGRRGFVTGSPRPWSARFGRAPSRARWLEEARRRLATVSAMSAIAPLHWGRTDRGETTSGQCGASEGRELPRLACVGTFIAAAGHLEPASGDEPLDARAVSSMRPQPPRRSTCRRRPTSTDPQSRPHVGARGGGRIGRRGAARHRRWPSASGRRLGRDRR